jgi:hypothetical protein
MVRKCALRYFGPFRLVAPEPYELDIHEACASALDKLLLPPAV